MNIVLKKSYTTLCLKHLACFIVLIIHHICYAERGVVEQSEPLFSPTQNFPEYFNTNVVPARRSEFNLPFGSFNIGATENFSLGFNIPLLFYMTESWNPAFMISARYRFFSNKKLSSTLSGYGGYFSFDDSDDNIKIYYINGTYNNSITINQNQFITTQINGISAQYKSLQKDRGEYEHITLNTIAVAIGHDYIMNAKWNLHNMVAMPILMNLYKEDSNSSSNISFKHIQNFPFIYRILFSWRVTQNSLLDFGGFFVVQSDIPFFAFPWLNWNVLL